MTLAVAGQVNYKALALIIFSIKTFLKPTDLSQTERQKTPVSLYHIQQKQISSVSYMVHMFVFSVFSIHRSDLLLLNMIQGARSFLSFCF